MKATGDVATAPDGSSAKEGVRSDEEASTISMSVAGVEVSTLSTGCTPEAAKRGDGSGRHLLRLVKGTSKEGYPEGSSTGIAGRRSIWSYELGASPPLDVWLAARSPTSVGISPLSPREPASTKRPRLGNETLDEPLPSNNLQYVSDPEIRIPILQHPIELQDEVSIESVKFLAMQGCAFRVHDESVVSKNRGNYLELVTLLGRMNPEIGSTLEKASKNAKYTSPKIQREILKTIADIVRDKIRAEIGEAKFCILIDEAIDESIAVSKKVHDVWRFFSTLTLAINFVGSSAKRHFQLKSIRKAEINDLIKLGEIDTGTESNQDCSLVRAGATRWSSHFNYVKRFIGLFGSVSILLQDLVNKGLNSNIRGEAKDKLCQTLQKNDIDILNAMNLVSTTRLNLQQIRDDRWEGFLWSLLKFYESNDVEVPNFDDCYTRVIDFQLMELNERFPEGTIELLTLSNVLSSVDGFKSFSFYYYDFNLEERGDLERELDHYKFDVPRHAQFQNLNSLHHLCQTVARTT
ncbi:uncharacterized protein LOC122050820 [Zingiber officinale]|uniref:uncharacterized protein LOC122050820 n=1 Tax=Zingiber officinale TaxID=94328 RepID=UPI001C4BFA78|nr:uncharacterized protein LOC122050820 [Zingiber officinale]